MAPTFRKIGQFEISVDGDFICVWSSSEFNLEAAQDYADAMETIVDQMPPTFGVLTRYESPPIVGPDVEASLWETAQQCARRGMVAVAFVVPTVDRGGLSIARAQWNRIYTLVGVALAIFSDVESAHLWLRRQIQSAREERGRAGN